MSMNNPESQEEANYWANQDKKLTRIDIYNLK